MMMVVLLSSLLLLLLVSLVLVVALVLEYMMRSLNSLFPDWVDSERVDSHQLMQDENKDNSHHSIHNDPTLDKLVMNLVLLCLSSAERGRGKGDELDDDKDKDFVSVQRCNDIYFEESTDNL